MLVTEEILKKNSKFIYKECLKVSKPNYSNWDDIKQEALIAFCKAYQSYDENKDKAKGFYYYASKYIRLYLLHYLDTKCNRIHYSKKIQCAIYEVRKGQKEGKDIEAILKKLNFSLLDKLEYNAYISERKNKVLYLSDIVGDEQSDDKGISYEEQFMNDKVEDSLDNILFKTDLERVLQEFEKKCKEIYVEDRKVVVAKRLIRGVLEGEEANQKELAEKYEMSRSMVNRLRKSVLEAFKQELIVAGLVKGVEMG